MSAMAYEIEDIRALVNELSARLDELEDILMSRIKRIEDEIKRIREERK